MPATPAPMSTAAPLPPTARMRLARALPLWLLLPFGALAGPAELAEVQLERVALDGGPLRPGLSLPTSRTPARHATTQVERTVLPVAGVADVAGRPVAASQQWMAWRQGSRFEWGVGVVAPSAGLNGPWAGERAAETTALPSAAGRHTAPTRAVVGVGRRLGAGASLQLDVSAAMPAHHPALRDVGGSTQLMRQASTATVSADGLETGSEWRVGLSFQGRDEGDLLRRGLGLKMALGSGSTLNIKPRARRLTLQLTSQW